MPVCIFEIWEYWITRITFSFLELEELKYIHTHPQKNTHYSGISQFNKIVNRSQHVYT